MTSKFIRTVAAFALLIVFASFGYGQTTLTTTTLSAAIDYKAKTFNVAAATNITGPALAESSGGVGKSTANNLTVLYVDREVMDVVSVSSTTVTVRRGTRGTKPTGHASSAKVWVGPAGQFVSDAPYGTCTRTLLQYVPMINVTNGLAYDCSGSPGKWGNFVDQPQIGADLASQGGEMTGAYAIIAKIHHVTGTAAITGFAIPAGLRSGDTFVTIPDGNFTWTAAGNIVSTGTAVTGRAITWTYDAATAKLYPNQ